MRLPEVHYARSGDVAIAYQGGNCSPTNSLAPSAGSDCITDCITTQPIMLTVQHLSA